MKDNWCKALKYKGKIITGGAARNARISKLGGMDNILHKVAYQAAIQAAQDIFDETEAKKLHLVK